LAKNFLGGANVEFIPGTVDKTRHDELVYCFIFQEDSYLTDAGKLDVPVFYKSELLKMGIENLIYLGEANNKGCFAAKARKDFSVPPGYKFHEIRLTYDHDLCSRFWLAGHAFHILNWDLKNKTCTVCKADLCCSLLERAKVCKSCGLTIYPRISPAIIVAVIKDNKILLARKNTYKKGYFSLISGFVEPGETLEACVAREVLEETGIKVKSIRYFGSQPWPFPDSLMIGFTAEYASGDISIDGNEISEADWFLPDNLPRVPGKHSIAGRLIDWFCGKYKNI
jgi:NAD+ diphosphatase